MRAATVEPLAGIYAFPPLRKVGDGLRDVANVARACKAGLSRAPGSSAWIIDQQQVVLGPKMADHEIVRGALSAAADHDVEVVAARVVAVLKGRPVYRALGCAVPCSFETALADAEAAANAAEAEVLKASLLDPSKPRDRRVIIRRLADALLARVRKYEVSAARAAREFLSADWPKLTPADHVHLLDEAKRTIVAVGMQVVPGINRVVTAEQGRVIVGARQSVRERFKLDIDANLAAADARAVMASQATTVSWLTDEYGRRAAAFERDGARIVGRGLEAGKGRMEIARDLRQAFGSRIAGRDEAYFNVYAGALVDRARSMSEVYSYRDAGITAFVAVAVQDEATTEFCRWVDGRVLSVEKSLRVAESAQLPGMSVAAMKLANPWVRERTLKNGERRAYVQHAGGSQDLFRIDQPGLGTQERGSYRDLLPPGLDLSALGLGLPPFHGLCRTTTMPA